MRKVFVLGCERSGSTWVSNILDAHPNVEFFMEPFADYADLFPGLPGRNIYLSETNNELVNLVRGNYERLYAAKYPLFYAPGKATYLRGLDDFLIRYYQLCGRLLKFRAPLKVDQYQLLNLNSSKIPIKNQTKKVCLANIEVTKELRLNFKIKFMTKVFPDAKYLVCIRHPGAQITSIKKLFQKKNLGELSKNLLSFVECIKGQERFRKFHDVIGEIDWESDIDNKLILWWLFNYDVLIDDLRNNNQDFLVIHNEDISENPVAKSNQMLKFCGLDMTSQVKQYISDSTSSESKTRSAVDTSRKSSEYYKNSIKEVDSDLQDKINKVFSMVECLPEIVPYSSLNTS